MKGHDSAESAGIVPNTYLGIAYFYLGDYRRAVEFHRNVETLHEDLTRERFGLAGLPAVIARAQLAWSLAELGQFSHGIACGEEGIRIAEAVRHPYSQILADWGVGSLYLRRGELDRAIRTLEHGLMLCRATDFAFLFLLVASPLDSAYALSGRLSEALPLLEQSVEASVSMKIISFRPLWLGLLSEAYLLAGRMDDAVELAGRALELARAHKERGFEGPWRSPTDSACAPSSPIATSASASYIGASANASRPRAT